MSKHKAELGKDEKRKFQRVSKIVGILARISSIIMWLGVALTTVGTITVLAVVPNIKVNKTEHYIQVYDDKMPYSRDMTELSFVDSKSNVKITLSEEDTTKVYNFIENNLETALTMVMIAMPVVVALCVISALMLGKIARLFKSIANEKSPFSSDNTSYMHKIFRYAAISTVITFALELFVGIALNSYSFSITTSGLCTLAIMYVALYVFKSGELAKA